MGRMPVFGLSGLFLAALALTGCDDSCCWWKDKGPNKSVTSAGTPTKDSAARTGTQAPFGSSANTGFKEQQSTTIDRTGFSKNENTLPDKGIDATKKPVVEPSREPVLDPETKNSASYGDPKRAALPDNDIPNDLPLNDVTPVQKPAPVEHGKVNTEPQLPLDEPPPVIPSGANKGPGLGGPTMDDLPPPPVDGGDSVAPPAPPPHRSRYQSDHQSMPTPPGAANAPPVIPSKAAGNPDKDQ
ncbi:MAG: hypothetical protein ACJ8FY_11090 [Gemmataceae bacterium]